MIRILGLVLCIFAVIVVPGVVSSQDQSVSRTLLIKLARDQGQTLCGSSAFTQCMGFTQEACLALSEESILQCLAPLPERIGLAELQNDIIEECPKNVYEEAGYPEEKAGACFDEAIEQQ